ncbi:MAG TPA: YbjN domain-containing protein [Anaerolineaceae bacterium]
MGNILETAARFFEQDGWQFEKIPNRPLIHTTYESVDHHCWECYAQERQDFQQLIFYSIFPLKAPPVTRYRLVEFLTRANFGMFIGNFEMDMSDGEIRYKTSMDFEDQQVTTGLIHNLVYNNVSAMERYYSGIQKMIQEDLPPKDVISEIEKDTPPV